jgi:histidinol phosphatase-like PHP family hydrolase
VKRDLLKDRETGRFFRGNLHCHSNRSDGLVDPEEVVGAYREAGYHFICLSDHFEAEYGWQITDTRPLRDESFTTIVGAELSSAPWEERDAYWVTAAGIPRDFDLAPFRGSYCRVTVVDIAGRRAWSNPIWP